MPVSDHQIFSITGASHWHCPGDLMHSGDLGVVQYLTASVLDELCEEWPGPLTAQGKADHLWRAIRSQYAEKRTSNRLSILKKEMWERRNDVPCLRAKAAESRALLEVLRDMCLQLHDRSDRDEHRARCMIAICEVYAIFTEGDIFLKEAESRAALCHYETFLLQYQTLLLKMSLYLGARRYGFYFKLNKL